MEHRFVLSSRLAFLVSLVCLLISSVASAQPDIRLSVDAENIGLGGSVRPGSWTPMLITLENRESVSVQVRCQWTLTDPDGDEVSAHRSVALTPGKSQGVWLYAVPPLTLDERTVWRVSVVDESSGQQVAMTSISLPASAIISPYNRIIGVTSAQSLALQPYAEINTQHEAAYFVRDIDPARLPDRWHGLSMMQALIWTPDAPNGSDPSSTNISSETRNAILEWVRRGGHLVIVLPAVGDRWSESPFRSLLGDTKMETVAEVAPPIFLGTPVSGFSNIEVKTFQPGTDATPLLRDKPASDPGSRVLAVAQPFGMGRVTLIGVDLTDKRLSKMGLPNPYTVGHNTVGELLWPTVFGWRGPVFSTNTIDSMRANNTLLDAQQRRTTVIDEPLIANLVSMSASTATPMLLAIVLFALYWFIAGPVSFGVLRQRDQLRHSWTVFCLVVLGCTVIAWGGAALLRQTHARIEHFSVVDFDTRGIAHAHSWFSAFSPHHGGVEMSLGVTNDDSNHNYLATPGISMSRSESGFLDPQRYGYDGGSPTSIAYPFRATARQIEADYLGRLDHDTGMPQEWVAPQGTVRMEKGWPVGSLKHELPGTLKDVIVVYVPANGREPWVWPWLREWPAGASVELKRPQNAVYLVVPPSTNKPLWGGYLGDLVEQGKPGNNLPSRQQSSLRLSSDENVKLAEMLTFYSLLPSPRAEKKSDEYLLPENAPMQYLRSIGRPADMSAMLAFRRLFIIGHLEQSPQPMPLKLDQSSVPSRGWTVVRWSTPILDEEK
ncbi:MAG: hypothetical protein IT444_07660 [Phycisphaeraceae bacterium]|nr:hypothetical protein [Phycisphaeraceae bacterium]